MEVLQKANKIAERVPLDSGLFLVRTAFCYLAMFIIGWVVHDLFSPSCWFG